MSENNNNNEQAKVEPENPMQILEDALVICKFGRFHIRLLLATLAAVFASTIVTTTTSYLLPNAECDLNMNIMQKGLLNSAPFIGQVGTTLFSGFLVDAFGRRIFLVGGHASMFILTIIEGSSQNYWMLFFMKILEGVSLSISYGTISAMVTEFTHKGVRDRVLMYTMAFMPMSLIGSALISWGLLPHQNWNFIVWQGYFEIHVWNIYLYVCSIFSLIATALYYTIPESPKYLFSHGQEYEALEVLKTVYNENTGYDKDSFPCYPKIRFYLSELLLTGYIPQFTLFLSSRYFGAVACTMITDELNIIAKNKVNRGIYPVKSLTTSATYKPTVKISFKKRMTDALFEAKDLFRRPSICKLLLFACLTFVCLLAYSALRLWYPQLSTVIENYQKDYGEVARFCPMINHYMQDKDKINITNINFINITEPDVCIPQISGSETYINGIILGLVSFLCISISGYLVDYMGQKLLMFILFILCAACSGALYWTSSSLQIAMLISAACALMQAALSLQQNVLLRVFPTTQRALAVSVIIMMGRFGSLLGSILFPILLKIGCMVPFVGLSVISLTVAGLVYYMPNPSKENKTGDK